MFGGGVFGGAPFGGEDPSGAIPASFSINPSVGHVAGSVTIYVSYFGGASCPASMPITIASGGGSVASWVQDAAGANGSGHFTFTAPAPNGTPTVFSDSVTSTTASYSNAAVAPAAPTIGTLTLNFDGTITVTFSAPADNGGASITGYIATSSAGGVSNTGAASPITISGPQSGAQTVSVQAVNIVGTGAASAASNSVTVPTNTCASFDGSGATYLSAICPSELQTYPFWVSCWVRPYRQLTYATVYCPWAAERVSSGGSNGHGTALVFVKQAPWAFVGAGASVAKAISDEAVLTDPYWDHILCEFVSSTSRNIYINNVLEGSNTTNVTPDLSAGSPEFRIGRRAVSGSTQYYRGEIADVVCGAGTLSSGDRALLATMDADYASIASADHWWKLRSDGLDAIGSADLSATGSISYVSGRPASVASPTREQAINEIFKATTLPTGTPTVTAGGTPPITVTTNLASVERMDWSFTGTFGAYNGRSWHYIPTTSTGHVVFVNGGHEFVADAATYGMDILVRQLVGAGYAVLQSFQPSFDPQNPDYPGSSTLHNTYGASYSASVNPVERFIQPNVICMNNLAARYAKRSVCGLSGGGWLAIHYGALDARINNSVISIRGGIADRRSLNDHDFEQWPKANGWKVEEFFRLAADPNRKLTFVVHQSDPSITAKTTATDSGAYLDAAGYVTKFLTPIASEFPSAKITFYEDQGAAPHAITQDAIDNAILPTLAMTVTITGSAAFTETADSAVASDGVSPADTHGFTGAQFAYLEAMFAAIPAAVFAALVDGTTTFAESIRLHNSVLAGKVSGAGTGTEVFRDLADTKARIVASVDGSGNRTSLIRDTT